MADAVHVRGRNDQLLPFNADMAEPRLAPLITKDIAALGGAYLLGTSIDHDTRPDHALRAFCLVRGTGEMVAIELVASHYTERWRTSTHVANSSLFHFLNCLLFFYESWLLLMALDADDRTRQRRFTLSYAARGLRHRDPRIFTDRHDYWSMVIAGMIDEI